MVLLFELYFKRKISLTSFIIHNREDRMNGDRLVTQVETDVAVFLLFIVEIPSFFVESRMRIILRAEKKRWRIRENSKKFIPRKLGFVVVG